MRHSAILALSLIGVMVVPAAPAVSAEAPSPSPPAAAESLEAAARLNQLGAAAWSRVDLATAREFYRQAVAIREKLAPGSLDLAVSLSGLGLVAWRQGDLAEAKGLHQRALAIQEKRAPSSLGEAHALNNLGLVLFDEGDVPGAKALYQRALAIREKLAPDSLDLAMSLNNLGIIARAEEDLAGSKALHERALAIREKRAPETLMVAMSLNNLGLIAYDQGDLARAEALHQRAMAIRQKLAPDSLDVAYSLNNLGFIAQSRADLTGARAQHERALAIRQRFAPRSLVVADSFNNLGSVAQAQGDLIHAREFHAQALAIREKLAPASLTVAYSLNSLGLIAANQGDLPAAREFYQRALAIRRQRAPGSLEVAYSLSNLAGLVDESGDSRQAIALYREALPIFEQRAPNSPAMAYALLSLSRLLLEGGTPAEVPAYFQRAKRIVETLKSVTPRPVTAGSNSRTPILPEVRFLEPKEDSEVQGEDVPVSLALLAPLPVAGYRVWINGRPFGSEHGFSLPAPGTKGLIVDKGVTIQKGLIMDKGDARELLTHQTPPEVAELARKLQYTHYVQVRQKLPVEDTDGAFLRIAVAAKTEGGFGSRQILRLRRPRAEASRGPLRVLAIGIGAYTNPRIPRLSYAAADARDLAAAFQAQAGEGKLYRSATVKVLTDAQATLPAIRQALAWLTRGVQKGETLVLALSGHGVKDGERFFFAPVGLDAAKVAETGLPWPELLAGLQAARRQARAIWVLADCCRAAPGLQRQATSADLRRGVDEEGNLVICTASSGDQPSYESDELKHGLFTQAWLEALRTQVGPGYEIAYEETPRGRVLTLSGLQFLVDASVIRHARQSGVRQKVEFPRLEGSFSPSQPLFVPVSLTH